MNSTAPLSPAQSDVTRPSPMPLRSKFHPVVKQAAKGAAVQSPPEPHRTRAALEAPSDRDVALCLGDCQQAWILTPDLRKSLSGL